MADKKGSKGTDYKTALRELREGGAKRIYFLWGEEDYLRESFFSELKKTVLADGFEDFNYKRFAAAAPDLSELTAAMDAVPFFGSGTLIELRGIEVNGLREAYADELTALLSAVPDYCTVVLLLPIDYAPDGRLGFVKALRKLSCELNFSEQEKNALCNWIKRRFAAEGKRIGAAEAEHLIFTSGSLMNGLIPEIEKLAAYAKGEDITKADIDAVATRLPETKVYYMTDALAAGDYAQAAAILSELLDMREHPIMLTAVIGNQMRKLYSARVALDSGLGWQFVASLWNIKQDFLARKLLTSAKAFRTEALARAVRLCAETDLKMKSTGLDAVELLKDLLLELAYGGAVC